MKKIVWSAALLLILGEIIYLTNLMFEAIPFWVFALLLMMTLFVGRLLQIIYYKRERKQ